LSTYVHSVYAISFNCLVIKCRPIKCRLTTYAPPTLCKEEGTAHYRRSWQRRRIFFTLRKHQQSISAGSSFAPHRWKSLQRFPDSLESGGKRGWRGSRDGGINALVVGGQKRLWSFLDRTRNTV